MLRIVLAFGLAPRVGPAFGLAPRLVPAFGLAPQVVLAFGLAPRAVPGVGLVVFLHGLVVHLAELPSSLSAFLTVLAVQPNMGSAIVSVFPESLSIFICSGRCGDFDRSIAAITSSFPNICSFQPRHQTSPPC